MWQKVVNELGKFTVAVIGLSLAILAYLLVSSPSVEILDYGKAFHFYNSTANRLFIQVTGRLKFRDGATWVALANHPREDTFDDSSDAYSRMIAASGGASTISFLMADNGRTVIERRYQAPQDEYTQHSCRGNPYTHSLVSEPAVKSRFLLIELNGYQHILYAATAGLKLYGVVTYRLDGQEVTLDFPAALVNINAKEGSPTEMWQLVSERVPLYVGGNMCEGIREGHAAFRQLNGPFDMVYLCRGADGINDFSCTKRIEGRLRVFAAYF